MRSQEANAMEGGSRLHQPTLSVRHWLFVLSGILLVAVPWWLGMLWMLGALS